MCIRDRPEDDMNKGRALNLFGGAAGSELESVGNKESLGLGIGTISSNLFAQPPRKSSETSAPPATSDSNLLAQTGLIQLGAPSASSQPVAESSSAGGIGGIFSKSPTNSSSSMLGSSLTQNQPQPSTTFPGERVLLTIHGQTIGPSALPLAALSINAAFPSNQSNLAASKQTTDPSNSEGQPQSSKNPVQFGSLSSNVTSNAPVANAFASVSSSTGTGVNLLGNKTTTNTFAPPAMTSLATGGLTLPNLSSNLLLGTSSSQGFNFNPTANTGLMPITNPFLQKPNPASDTNPPSLSQRQRYSRRRTAIKRRARVEGNKGHVYISRRSIFCQMIKILEKFNDREYTFY
eukprot:TRINITY_DN16363_c0_g1_i2.p1 TRINITY_DN16363_c0_g1~~TRINITY_DN16363_c0_g1_i2.p1  ORF type:complete len:348 (+),score=5.76 TRINITY_DN16363_c0_g1_i2:64-1107(+)